VLVGRGRWQQVVVMCEQYKEQEGIGQIDRYSWGSRLRYRHFQSVIDHYQFDWSTNIPPDHTMETGILSRDVGGPELPSSLAKPPAKP
jgi:hypothetical protein